MRKRVKERVTARATARAERGAPVAWRVSRQRRAIRAWTIAAAVWLPIVASRIPARAQIPPSLGFDVPFLVGPNEQSILPIDIGADGITDFVVEGWGILEGEVILPLGPSSASSSVHLIVHDAGHSWRLSQTFLMEGSSLSLDSGDVNGDGLEDLIAHSIGESWGDRMHAVYLQGPDGRFIRSHEIAIPGMVPDYTACAADGSGRIYLIRTERGGVTTTFRAMAVQWTPSGVSPIWSESVAIPDSTHQISDPFAFLSSDSALVYLSRTSGAAAQSLAIPVHPNGLGQPYLTSFIVGSSDQVVALKRGGRSDLFLWDGEHPETLRQLIALQNGDSAGVRPVTIRDIPPGLYISKGFAAPGPDGSTFIMGNAHDRSRSMSILLAIDGASAPDGSLAGQVLSTWARGRLDHIALASAPWETYGVQVLCGSGVGLFLSAPRSPAPLPAQGSVRFDKDPVLADFTGDGIADVAAYGHDEGNVGCFWFLRGIGGPPWFGDPEPITQRETGHMSKGPTPADLDGDGTLDLLIQWGPDDSTLVCTPYFWEGWRMKVGEAQTFVFPEGYYSSSDLLEGDLDADGRTELVLLSYPGGKVIGWERDRSPRPPVSFDTREIHSYSYRGPNVVDLDGDGVDEVVDRKSNHLVAWRIDPSSGAVSKAVQWRTKYWTNSVAAADLDDDGSKEVLWTADFILGVSRFPPGGGEAIGIAETELGVGGFGGDIRTGDIDQDGRTDVLLGIGSYVGGLVAVLFDPLGRPDIQVRSLPELTAGNDLVASPTPAWCDLDRDGDLDYVAFTDRGYIVHRNDSNEPGAGRSPGNASWVRFAGANPALGSARIAVRAPGPSGPISLNLYDVSGRAVWRAVRTAPASEWIEVVIDPRPDGRPAPAGIYFLRVEGGGHEALRRIVFAH